MTMKKLVINKNKRLIVYIVLIFLCVSFAVGLGLFINNSKSKNILGVWWWNNKLDASYLDFAESNNVTEIYYYSSSFTEKTSEFIKNANNKGMKVFWLTGDCKWINNFSLLEEKVNNFIEYQNVSQYKFDGIHFDIEPHQLSNFETDKINLLTKFVELVYQVKNKYSNIYIEYDIPVWLHDKISFNNQTKPVYEFIIDYSNKITLMSYRDSFQEIYNSIIDELNYAISVNKVINFAVETQDNLEDDITFVEEGEEFMFEQIKQLKNIIPQNYGVAIHHIVSWVDLKK